MNTASTYARLPAARTATTLLLLSLLAACGGERSGSPAPAQFTDVRRHALHVGLGGGEPDQAALGGVVAARLTDDARHVVVLDFVAPFVKVFDGAGRFQAAFVNRGGGPGEASAPTALAVSGDSLMLVADAKQGLSVYDLAGNLRAHARVPGLVTLAAAAPCAGEWLLYGPRLDGDRRGGAARWLHRVRFSARGEPSVQSMLPDTLPRFLSGGLPYGLVADGRGAVVRHTLGRRPQVLRVECGAAEPRVLRQGEAVEASSPERVAQGVRTSITPGMRAPAGVAALGRRVVYGEKVHVSAGEDRLDLTLLGAGADHTVSIAGDYVLRDSRPGVGVLVSTVDPVPQLFLLRPAEFEKVFAGRR